RSEKKVGATPWVGADSLDTCECSISKCAQRLRLQRELLRRANRQDPLPVSVPRNQGIAVARPGDDNAVDRSTNRHEGRRVGPHRRKQPMATGLAVTVAVVGFGGATTGTGDDGTDDGGGARRSPRRTRRRPN